MRTPRPVWWIATLCTVVVASGCGDSSDTKKSSTSHAKQRTSTTKTSTTAEPTRMPDKVAPGKHAPIVITSPAPFTTVVGSLVLAGTAQAHEGALAWAILGTDLTPLIQGRLTASCGAPCRGTFRQRISLAKVPLGSWELHVWSPNTDDSGPERLHDTMVPITVSDRVAPGTPAPGTEPPGGPPQA